MDAIILLLISIFVVSLYGFIYVTYQLMHNIRLNNHKQFIRSFFVLLTVVIGSGSSVYYLLIVIH